MDNSKPRAVHYGRGRSAGKHRRSPDPNSIPMSIPSAGITTSTGKHISADMIEIDDDLPFKERIRWNGMHKTKLNCLT